MQLAQTMLQHGQARATAMLWCRRAFCGWAWRSILKAVLMMPSAIVRRHRRAHDHEAHAGPPCALAWTPWCGRAQRACCALGAGLRTIRSRRRPRGGGALAPAGACAVAGHYLALSGALSWDAMTPWPRKRCAMVDRAGRIVMACRRFGLRPDHPRSWAVGDGTPMPAFRRWWSIGCRYCQTYYRAFCRPHPGGPAIWPARWRGWTTACRWWSRWPSAHESELYWHKGALSARRR